jgi:hypothetical protein
MAIKKLIANERFYYAGRNVEMGEEFDAEETDVALLTHAVKPMAKVMEAEPKRANELGRTEKPEPETQGERRSYKRRDMKAED